MKKHPLLKIGRITGAEAPEVFFAGKRDRLLVKFEILNGHAFTKEEIMSIIESGLGAWAGSIKAALAAAQTPPPPPTPPAIQGNSADVAALQALGVQAGIPLPAINADGTITAPVAPAA